MEREICLRRCAERLYSVRIRAKLGAVTKDGPQDSFIVLAADVYRALRIVHAAYQGCFDEVDEITVLMLHDDILMAGMN